MGQLECSAVNWYFDRMEAAVGWLVSDGLIYTSGCWEREVVTGCSIAHH